MTRRRQTFTLTVTSRGQSRPSYLARKALDGQDRITDFTLTPTAPAVSLPSPNRERLIALAVWAAGEQAKQELGLPSEWDQRDWLLRTDCGTACCIAGKVALDDGGVPVRRDGDWATAEIGEAAARVTFPGQDGSVRADEYAQKALGLTRFQAYRLFSGSNDLYAVLAAIRDLLAEDDEQPATGPDCDTCYEDVPDSEPTGGAR